MSETIPAPVAITPQNSGELGVKTGLGEIFKDTLTKTPESFKPTAEGAKMADTIDSSILRIKKDNLDPINSIQEIAFTEENIQDVSSSAENIKPPIDNTTNPNIIIGNQVYETLQRKINARTNIFKSNGLIDSQADYLSKEKTKDYDDFVKQHPTESKAISSQDPEMQAAIDRAQQPEAQDESKTNIEQTSDSQKEILQRLDKLAQENDQIKQQLSELMQQNSNLTETIKTQQELQEKLKPVVEELVSDELEGDETAGDKPAETEEEKKKKRKQLLKTILMIVGGVGVVAAAGVVSSSKS